jgi:hypothetical protein
VAHTAGWPIELSAGTDGDLEVRAYVGFGSSAPAHAVRITRRAGHTTGQLLLWWAGTTMRFDVPDDPERPIAQHDQETWAAAMRQRVRSIGCSAVRRGGWVETCVLDRSREVDWSTTLAQLESAGLERVRSPRADQGVAGASLFLQLRAGSRLTVYSAAIPDRPAANADGRSVARLADLLVGLF